jgi:hypothetical protein
MILDESGSMQPVLPYARRAALAFLQTGGFQGCNRQFRDREFRLLNMPVEEFVNDLPIGASQFA